MKRNALTKTRGFLQVGLPLAPFTANKSSRVKTLHPISPRKRPLQQLEVTHFNSFTLPNNLLKQLSSLSPLLPLVGTAPHFGLHPNPPPLVLLSWSCPRAPDGPPRSFSLWHRRLSRPSFVHQQRQQQRRHFRLLTAQASCYGTHGCRPLRILHTGFMALVEGPGPRCCPNLLLYAGLQSVVPNRPLSRRGRSVNDVHTLALRTNIPPRRPLERCLCPSCPSLPRSDRDLPPIPSLRLPFFLQKPSPVEPSVSRRSFVLPRPVPLSLHRAGPRPLAPDERWRRHGRHTPTLWPPPPRP